MIRCFLLGCVFLLASCDHNARSGTIQTIPVEPVPSIQVLTTTTGPDTPTDRNETDPGDNEVDPGDAAATDLDFEILARHPHDTSTFTQGLLLHDGRLFESSGRFGQSSIREVDVVTGSVARDQPIDAAFFAEGLASVDDRLIQLTWLAGVAIVHDRETFAELQRFSYSGEGWGLCFDGERLIMSDGTPTLSFRDPNTFEALGSVQVTLNGSPVERLNELECVDGSVWANVWQTDTILRIDPTSGRVTGVLDTGGLFRSSDPDAVLNGIAYDPDTGDFLITGKLWPELFRIRITG